MFDRRTTLAMIAGAIATPAFGMAQDSDGFDSLLSEVEADNDKFPGAAGQLEAKELSKVVFGAAQPNYGKSKRQMNARTIAMITAFEVSNKKGYEARYRQPVWPGKDSGVTFAIGYDLGYVSKTGLDADWRGYIDDDTRKLLVPVLGLKRMAARDAVAKVQAVDVGYDLASRQFVAETLPKYVAQTEYALPNTATLSDNAIGALASLTFNRGPSYLVRPENDPKGRYTEMREIRRLMREKKFAQIPAQIRSMKRLWDKNSDVGGLIARREIEAKLFELAAA